MCKTRPHISRLYVAGYYSLTIHSLSTHCPLTICSLQRDQLELLRDMADAPLEAVVIKVTIHSLFTHYPLTLYSHSISCELVGLSQINEFVN